MSAFLFARDWLAFAALTAQFIAMRAEKPYVKYTFLASLWPQCGWAGDSRGRSILYDQGGEVEQPSG